MKKIVAVVSALALTVSLAACQLKDEKPVSKSAAPVAEKVVKKEVKKSEKEVTLEALSGEVRSLRFRVKRLEDVARAHGLAQ
jgi:uncharacterized lipoprotein YbaY